jgi:hypothetical protein
MLPRVSDYCREIRLGSALVLNTRCTLAGKNSAQSNADETDATSPRKSNHSEANTSILLSLTRALCALSIREFALLLHELTSLHV